MTSINAGELKQFIERAERVQDEMDAIKDDMKELFQEMKGRGFDTKIVRKILAIRKQDESDRQMEDAMLDLYMTELGMV